jgi:hypothetical protein
MRFFEFAGDDGVDKFVMVLRNYIGRASSKKAPAKLNWNGLQQVLRSNGFEISADYETFKAMYDASPAIQNLVKNFNDKGIELNVPGAPKDAAEQEPTQGGETSQDVVDKTAASAAAGQLSQNQATPQI